MQRSDPLAGRLAAIVLGFESLIAFLGGLALYGLRALPVGVEPWWGIVAGAVMMLLMIVAAGLARFRVGIVMGWVLQFVVLAGAFLNLAFIVVFLVFGGMYAYAMITSARLARTRPAMPDTTESE